MSATVLFVLLTGMAVSSFFALQSAARNRQLQQETTRANKKTIEADSKADEARRHLYAAHMNLAQSNWDAGHVGATLELLARYAPGTPDANLRGFEWYYRDRLCHSELLTLEGHAAAVHALAFSPNKNWLASVSQDNTVKVWDAATGRELLTLKGHKGPVHGVAFSPDGKCLASANVAPADDQFHPGRPRVWDVTSGSDALMLQGDMTAIHSWTFSPDGRRLATATDNFTIKVWDTGSGVETLSAPLVELKYTSPIVRLYRWQGAALERWQRKLTTECHEPILDGDSTCRR